MEPSIRERYESLRIFGTVEFVNEVVWYNYRTPWDQPPVAHPINVSRDSTWTYGNWQHVSHVSEATHIVLFAHSDYSGSGVDCSNVKALHRDFPRSTCIAQGGHETEALIVSLRSRDESLCDAVCSAVTEYPLYDEEHYDEMEMEAASEAWDQFLKADMMYQLHEIFRDEYHAEDYFDDFAEEHGSEIEEWYYESLNEGNGSPYFEAAHSIVFPEHAESIRYVVNEIIAHLLSPYTNPAQGKLI